MRSGNPLQKGGRNICKKHAYRKLPEFPNFLKNISISFRTSLNIPLHFIIGKYLLAPKAPSVS